MTLSFDSQIATRLDLAEQNVRCLFPRSRNDGRRLARRTQDGKVIRVQPGYFARTSYWNGLDAQQRFAHVLKASAEQHPHIVFTGFAAAHILGLALAKERMMHVRPKDLASSADYPDHVYLHGYRISPLHETLFDCMGAVGFAEGLALVDSALRGYTGLDKTELTRHFRQRGMRSAGFRHATKALELGDGACAHPDLSYARGMVYQAGFAIPKLENGTTADFCWQRANGTVLHAKLLGRSKRYAHVAPAGPVEAASQQPPRNIMRLTPDLFDDATRLTEVLNRANVPRRP